MHIRLQTTFSKEIIELEREEPFAIEELANEYQDQAPYRFLLARVNGVDRELTTIVDRDADIRLYDQRDHAADLAYQRSLSFLYLCALKEVLGVDADIDNSLNRGLYTDIKIDRQITDVDIVKVQARMREMVEADIPIRKILCSVKQGIKIWEDQGCPEKVQLLEEIYEYAPNFDVRYYDLRGHLNYFFGLMVPSTGYIERFELLRYGPGVLLRFPYYTDPNEMPAYIDDFKMYGAFGEEDRWMKILRTLYLPDLNRAVNTKLEELILLSEALHEKKISDIADEILKEGRRIVLIAGPSSSGKTTFAQRLCIQLRVNGLDPMYMGTDDYFVERSQTPLDENGEPDYENLGAIDIDLFNHDLNGLLAGETVDLPRFDFLEGKKIFGTRMTSIHDNQLIVIEGIHALNRSLTAQVDDSQKFRIYISPLTQLNIDRHNRVPSTDARMLRRMVRDYKYRNHSAAETIATWPKVRAGENKNIFPYNGEGDVLFNSVLEYEIPMLKKYADPLLREIKPDQPEYSEARRMLKFLEFFTTIEDESIIPNNSIIREFIGGSVFMK